MVRRFLFVSILVLAPNSASSEIFLVSEGLRNVELSVVYCNRFSTGATLKAITGGHFQEQTPLIPARSCKEFRLLTDRKYVLVHAIAEGQIDVLKYEHRAEPWLSRTAWFGLFFTLIGLFLGTLQEMMKTAIAQPAALLSLIATYYTEKRRFKLFMEDGGKRFVLSQTLIDLAEGKPSQVTWLPSWLLKRIIRLVAVKTAWQNEALSDELRASIRRL